MYNYGEPTTDTNRVPVDMEDQGMVSIGNSTKQLLSGGATWTGDWEDIKEFMTVSVIGKADQIGTLYIDFSTDGTADTESITTFQISKGDSGDFGYHAFVRIARYYRLRLVNGPTPQTSVSVQSFCNQGAAIAIPASRAQETVDDYTSVLNVRQLSETQLDEAAGRQANRSVELIFGHNPAVALGTSEHINLIGGATYPGFLTAAAAVRIKAGGNAADASGGVGARTIMIVGLDSNWLPVSAVLTCNANGTLVSDPTTQTFIRVQHAYVATSGTYTAANTGPVEIETDGGVTVALIGAAHGAAEAAHFTIPAGKTGYIRGLQASVEGNKPADIDFWVREDADVIEAPFTAPKVWFVIASLEGELSRDFESYPGPFPEKSDTYVTAEAGGANTSVSASYDIVLIDN